MNKYFIERPILSSVIAIIVVLAGAITIPMLPITQYPNIVPPQVSVSATYEGANSQQVVDNVTVPMENEINGVEGMLYIQSVSSNEGLSNITVTFDIGYDLDIATVDVQNRVSEAQSQIPPEVLAQGIDITQKSTNIVQVINLYSENKTRDTGFLSNYASINLVNELLRIKGVGSITVFGERTYSMRIWLDPDKLAGHEMTPTMVANAIKSQNTIAPVGSIGAAPSPEDQVFTFTINSKGALDEVGQFENIVLSANNDGSVVKIKDIANTEMGAENYQTAIQLDGMPSVGLAIYQLPGSNALDISKNVRLTMERLQADFPSGLDWKIPYDTTIFIDLSIDDVLNTLLIALVLVVAVVFVFLQNWRTTVVPSIAIPVALIGTFALMLALGFSINLLTLFGMVLAIGLVIDDAIVVIENITRLIEEGVPPRKAAIMAMREVAGPVIASTLVMMSVFIPAAFMPGITGQLYQQFALTIACSLLLSLVNAMTFTPALAGVTLKPMPKPEESKSKKQFLQNFFDRFNAFFDKATNSYKKGIVSLIKHRRIVMTGYALVILATLALFFLVPGGFVPEEDQGWIIVDLELNAGASLARTEKAIEKAAEITRKVPGVAHTVAVTGFDIINSAQSTNAGVIFVILKPYDERSKQSETAQGIIKILQKELFAIEDALAIAINAPPIPGMSSTGGFQYVLEDQNNAGLHELSNLAWAMIGTAKKKDIKPLGPLFTTFQVNVPTLVTEIDREKVFNAGVSLEDLYDNLQANLGSLYVNQFNKYDQVYQVYIQARKDRRSQIGDINTFYVENNAGQMLPIANFVTIKRTISAGSIIRYNLYNSAIINGGPAPGYSSGMAMYAMEKLSEKLLPKGFGYEWTGTAYQQEKSGNAAPIVFGLSLILVFLVMAALYESWMLPFMIMLAVPGGIFGALVFQYTRGLTNDVYCQIALVMLIGLAAKNAILIVQFANAKRMTGTSIMDSVIYAASTRLRPILMTALAFVLGVAPLVWATGASAASRQTLGTAVFGGMIINTLLVLVFVPVIYYILESYRERFVNVLPEGVVDQEPSNKDKPDASVETNPG